MSETSPVPLDAERPAGRKRPSFLLWIASGVVVAVLALIFTGPCSEISAIGTRDMDYGRIIRTGNALRIYASEHEGHLPPALSTLVPNYVPEAEMEFLDLKTANRSEWLYFPREKLESLPPRTILLAAPGPFSIFLQPKTRLVWAVDPGATSIPEADFQRLIREQTPPAASPSPDD